MGYNTDLATALLFGLFVALLVLRTPIAFALAISAAVTALYTGFDPLRSLAGTFRQMEGAISGWGMLAIPFFILAGEIMSSGSISRRLLDFANALVGRFRGGLASVNILGSMFFGGVSGSSVADTSSTGAILIPAMTRRGYDPEYAVAVTISSSTQGIIIPPSHNAIIFAIAFGYPYIDRLFLGGVIPGVMIGLSLMAVAYVLAVARGYPKEAAVGVKEVLARLVVSIPPLLTAVIIVGGILTGWFTAYESAVMAVVYALFLSVLVYRDLSPRELGGVLLRAVRTIGMVMLLIGAAGAFGMMMTRLDAPSRLTELLLGLTADPTLMMLLVLGVMLALGCFMDMAPLILILTPILKPAAVDVIGMHPVHFGIVMLLALGIGLITPPVGSTLFVGCSIGKTSIEKTAKTLLPFYVTLLVVLLVVTFVPGVTLWLVDAVTGL